MGTLKRIEGLQAAFEGAGAEVEQILLRSEHPARARDVLGTSLPALVRGDLVPETLSWSVSGTLGHLHRIAPDIVLCCTSRAFHPKLTQGPWHTVLDFIDRLSVSYRDRSTVRGVGLLERGAFRCLAGPNTRFERRSRGLHVTRIAAGWTDARELQATWVPVTIPVPDSVSPPEPHTDLLFFGNLKYPPNVEAVRRLSDLWPAVLSRRPGATIVVAGRNPLPLVRAAAEQRGWTLEEDFDQLGPLIRSVRLAVVPLWHASGIQIKVLEAAAHGLPQILSPAARAGLDPDFPSVTASDDSELLDQIDMLLDDPTRRQALGAASREHVSHLYTSESWVGWARTLLQS